eukprot:1158483-Pelagomonas_calceolata.AAC.16
MNRLPSVHVIHFASPADTQCLQAKRCPVGIVDNRVGGLPHGMSGTLDHSFSFAPHNKHGINPLEPLSYILIVHAPLSWVGVILCGGNVDLAALGLWDSLRKSSGDIQ